MNRLRMAFLHLGHIAFGARAGKTALNVLQQERGLALECERVSGRVSLAERWC